MRDPRVGRGDRPNDMCHRVVDPELVPVGKADVRERAAAGRVAHIEVDVSPRPGLPGPYALAHPRFEAERARRPLADFGAERSLNASARTTSSRPTPDARTGVHHRAEPDRVLGARGVSEREGVQYYRYENGEAVHAVAYPGVRTCQYCNWGGSHRAEAPVPG